MKTNYEKENSMASETEALESLNELVRAIPVGMFTERQKKAFHKVEAALHADEPDPTISGMCHESRHLKCIGGCNCECHGELPSTERCSYYPKPQVVKNCRKMVALNGIEWCDEHKGDYSAYYKLAEQSASQ